MSDPAHDVEVKLDRAIEHLRELEAESTVFYQADPQPVSVEPEPHGLYYVLRQRLIREPPYSRWAVLIGDAVHNARCALDYVAWQLAERNAPMRTKPDRLTLFPLFGDEVHYRTVGVRRLRHVGDDARTLIESLQPYNRPDPAADPLLWLEDLDVTDKHKCLVLVGFTVEPLRFFAWSRGGRRIAPVAMHPPGPVNDSAALVRFILPPNSQVKMEGRVTYEVRFGKGPCQGREPVAALSEILVRVEGVIDLFRPYLA